MIKLDEIQKLRREHPLMKIFSVKLTIIMSLIFVLPIAAPFSNICEASSVITDDRATADYWTARIPRGDDTYLAPKEIQSVNRLMREKSHSLVDLSNFPSAVSRSNLEEMIFSAQQDFRGKATLGDYYDASGKSIEQKDYLNAHENCNLSSLAARTETRYAVTTERANIRLLPTKQSYFDNPDFLRYDRLQGTAVDPAEPLLVLHESKDKNFVFVQSRNYSGWVKKDAIAFTNRATWKKYAAPKNFLVVTANKKVVKGANGELLFQMGSVLPLRRAKRQSDGTWSVNIPVRKNGSLKETTVSLAGDDTVHKGWLPCTKNNFVRQAMRFLGDEYDWGGMTDSVDCSSYVGDVYRSMGIEIPRDADQQELAMPMFLNFSGRSVKNRSEVMKHIPVGALCFRRGHVMMYLGEDSTGAQIVIHSSGTSPAFRGGVLVSYIHTPDAYGSVAIERMTSVGYVKN